MTLNAGDSLRNGGKFSYLGQVGDDKNHYKIKGLVSGERYKLTMSDLQKDADLYVYENANFSGTLGQSQNTGRDDDVVTFTSSGSQVFVTVHLYDNDGTPFTLTLE